MCIIFFCMSFSISVLTRKVSNVCTLHSKVWAVSTFYYVICDRWRLFSFDSGRTSRFIHVQTELSRKRKQTNGNIGSKHFPFFYLFSSQSFKAWKKIRWAEHAYIAHMYTNTMDASIQYSKEKGRLNWKPSKNHEQYKDIHI